MRVLAAVFVAGLLGPALVAQAPGVRLLTAPPQDATPAVHEATTRFDPQKLKLAWNQRRWQLVHDGHVLKDFGHAEQEARQALRLIHDLGLTEYATIGSPRPVMEYWLSDGEAPKGLVRGGLRALSIDLGTLSVEHAAGTWCVRERGRILFSFGNEADARHALAVIRKHRFGQVGLLGSGAPVMTIFFAQGDGVGGNGRHFGVTKFSRLAKGPDGSPRVEKPNKPTGLESVAPAVIPPVAAREPAPHRGGPQWRGEPHFGRPAATAVAPSADGRVGFDCRQVQLRHLQGNWKLMAGGQELASFGPNVQDARLLLSAVRYYRCTEQHRLGGAAAGRWFVVGPSGPRGVMFGLTAVPIDPERLQVQNMGGQFTLCQEGKVVMPVGPQADDARALLEMIKRHGSDRLCRLGDVGEQGVALLLKSR